MLVPQRASKFICAFWVKKLDLVAYKELCFAINRWNDHYIISAFAIEHHCQLKKGSFVDRVKIWYKLETFNLSSSQFSIIQAAISGQASCFDFIYMVTWKVTIGLGIIWKVQTNNIYSIYLLLIVFEHNDSLE